MKKFLVIEVTGWSDSAGRDTWSEEVRKQEVDTPADYQELSWETVIGLDKSTPRDWMCNTLYEETDNIWEAKLVTEDEAGEVVSEELVSDVYESDIVSDWIRRWNQGTYYGKVKSRHFGEI